jgi:hypothetical protein
MCLCIGSDFLFVKCQSEKKEKKVKNLNGSDDTEKIENYQMPMLKKVSSVHRYKNML